MTPPPHRAPTRPLRPSLAATSQRTVAAPPPPPHPLAPSWHAHLPASAFRVRQVGFFASKPADAEAQADLLRRVAFALWVGDHNQYVGALQGMLLDRLVAAFKFGNAGDAEPPARASPG